MHKLGPLVALLLLCHGWNLAAQKDTDRANYALLWEISGNGLEAPSYVFGSMHVRNKSVFEFPDSLLYYLNACDAFANEVHLDSAIHRVFQLYNEGIELPNAVYQEGIVTADELLPAGDFREEDEDFDATRETENFAGGGLPDNYDENANKSTMLDAYLMNIAKAWGKPLYGLEIIDQHLADSEQAETNVDFIQSLVDFNEVSLFELYYQGDIEVIGEFIMNNRAQFESLDLTPRNYVMVNRMEALMAEQSLFTVVGTAHLPGEEGVVNLLRERGYHLRPVTATFGNPVLAYNHRQSAREWTPRQGVGETYQFATPLDFFYQKQESFSETYYCFDIGHGIGYQLLVEDLLPGLYDDFEEDFFGNQGYEVLARDTIEYQGFTGFEYALEKPWEEPRFYRGRVFFQDQRMYYLQVSAYEKPFTFGREANAFFNQFELTAPSMEWTTVTDSTGAYRIQLPMHHLSSETVVNDSWNQQKLADENHHFLRGITDHGLYLLHWHDPAPGQQLENDRQGREEVLALLGQLLGEEFPEPEEVTFRDRTCLKLQAILREGRFLTAYAFVRGNRSYLVAAINDYRHDPAADKWFKSFTLLPWQSKAPFAAAPAMDSSLVFHLPDDYHLRPREEWAPLPSNLLQQETLLASDGQSGNGYALEVSQYAPLYGIDDLEEFWSDQLAKHLQPGDEVLEETTVTIDGRFPGKHYLIGSKGTEVRQRLQWFISGDLLVKQACSGTRESLHAEQAERFFADIGFRMDAEHWKRDLIGSKKQELLSVLSQAEGEELNLASRVITPSTFNSQDREQLLHILQLRPKLVERDTAFRETMVRTILALDMPDPLAFTEEMFRVAPKGSALRYSILSEVLNRDGFEHIQLFYQLLDEDDELLHRADAALLAPIRRSPKLLTANFDYWLRWVEERREPALFWKLLGDIWHTSPAHVAPLNEALPTLIHQAGERLAHWQTEPEYARGILSFYQAAEVKESSVAQQLRKLLQSCDEAEISLLAAEQLLVMEEELPRSWLKRQLTDDEVYLATVRLLNRYGRLAAVPKRLYSPERIARGLLADYFEREELEAEDVIFHESRVIPYQGTPQRFYLFRFRNDGRSNHLAIVGGFPVDEADRRLREDDLITHSYYPVARREIAEEAENLVEQLDNDW